MKVRPSNFSYLCSHCLILKKANMTFLPVSQNGEVFICSECAVDRMDTESKSVYFLG